MEYRTLGRTGIRVSEVGMGCEGFDNKTAAQTAEMVDFAMSKGINFIEIYSSNPVLRANLGEAFSRYPRESFVVQGHIGSTWQDGQYKRTRNISECKAAFEDFMRLMKLDFVDIGCIHYCDEERDYDAIFGGEIIEYAKQLKAQGKIKAIGLSTHNTAIARRAVDSGLVDVILFSINPAYDMLPASDDIDALFDASTFDRTYEGIDPERSELYGLCRNEGVALIVMKGYAGGLLLSDKQSPFGRALTAVQCIHYCLTRPAVASVMVGAHSIGEFADAASYSDAS
ncbi:MAG: aldo/keto reductase, partial [Clostridiales bacterium]|nr:aldo/keto reductase [Clostridiales bacterium]